jgi:hypothetical protein
MHPPCTYQCPQYEQAETVGCRARRQQLLQQSWNFYSNEGPLLPSSSSYDAQRRQDPADAQPCGQEMVTVLVGGARCWWCWVVLVVLVVLLRCWWAARAAARRVVVLLRAWGPAHGWGQAAALCSLLACCRTGR